MRVYKLAGYLISAVGTILTTIHLYTYYSGHPAILTDIRPATFLCLILAGVQLILSKKALENPRSRSGIIVSACSFMIIFVMLRDTMVYIPFEMVLPTFFPPTRILTTSMYQLPSIMDICGMYIVAGFGQLLIFNGKYYRGLSRFLADALILIGLSACLGRILHLPAMYFEIPHISAGLPYQLAIILLIYGLSIYLITNHHNETNKPHTQIHPGGQNYIGDNP